MQPRPAIASAEELRAARQALGLTQEDVATALGVTTRAYQEIEAGRSRIRPWLSLAIELISLRRAIGEGRPEFALPVIRREAETFAEMLESRVPS